MLSPPPLSLYVHLPWCVRKCPYCDFNSHTAGDATPKGRYIDALQRDLAKESQRAGDREITTVFLGGGTPSLFSPQEIAEILKSITASFAMSATAEITMEANPGTVECGSPAAYREAGINRLSIGAQSFDDGMLQRLGRLHSSDDIRRTVEDAREGGLNNFNVDVMHGLPGQTATMAMDDLRAAIALQPAHLSWYQLTLEPNTVFYSRPPSDLPDDDLAFEIQEQGQALISAAGFAQYEVSAYARDGQPCKHNLNYWLFGDYLAVGAGAHGKYTNGDSIFRYQKPANPMQYMQAIEADGADTRMQPLEAATLVFEFMLNASRLTDGFSEQVFSERTGLSAEVLWRASKASRDRGLIERQGSGHWRPTPLGLRFLNDLQADFLVER